MGELREELIELDARVIGYGRKIRELYRNSEICQRLSKVEGIGPVTATALVVAVGDRSSFKNGRQFAAWLGLVSLASKLQAIRAFLLASATPTMLGCRRCRILPSHKLLGSCFSRTRPSAARAPWISKVRR
jgi:transposase